MQLVYEDRGLNLMVLSEKSLLTPFNNFGGEGMKLGEKIHSSMIQFISNVN